MSIHEIFEQGVDPRYIYKSYELNINKVNSVDDCKKILKFLCDIYLKPLPIDCEYDHFGDVAKYFKR